MAISDEILADAGATEALVKAYLGGDDHTNQDPVNDDAADLDAVDFNKVVKAVAELVKRARPGNLVKINYELTTTPGSATTSIPRSGSSQSADILHRDGSLVGITAWFESNISAGSATIEMKRTDLDGGDPQTSTLSVVVPNGERIGIARQLPSEAVSTSEVIDASAFHVIYAQVVTSGTTWAASDKLHVNMFFSIGEEEDI